ncbi:unnamed protein product [Peronospora belbahrii]|uniref:Uncharacterized protein n=1 Tax=Peronospora belbahrii TaxID=622444 RepID=A0ABN8D6H7_9STRA|nr:unnamed protein product [Peronospora belbahrii]
MTTSGGGTAPEPSKEPLTSNGTPSPVKCNMNKTKRLLPNELRKRRRAAKLQVSAENKTQPRLTQEATEGKGNALHDQFLAQETEEASDSELSTVIVQKAASLALCAEKKVPLVAVDTATRLHSLYASSFLSQKKRRKLIPAANVPNIFYQVTDLPLDIVPKTKLSILTAFPYPFARVNSRIKKQALQQFVAGSAIQSTFQNNAIQWQQALHYFVHPADSAPASMLFTRTTGENTSKQLVGGLKSERKRVENDFLTARWNTWQKAFRDVYMSFRRGSKAHDTSFYLRSSNFVVYFHYETGSEKTTKETEDISSILNLCRQHGTEAKLLEKKVESKCIKNRKLRAVMSQSSGRTRKALHHLNVAYTMPYINAKQTQREVGEFHMLAEELDANCSSNRDNGDGTTLAPIARGTFARENMRGADSLLLFHGHDAVHGLYEFLINRARKWSAALCCSMQYIKYVMYHGGANEFLSLLQAMSNQDVPELYALHPFANASIQNLQVTSFGRVGGAPTESLAADQSSRSNTLFRTEILGFCFASSIARLLAILKDEWETIKISHSLSASAVNEESAIGMQRSQIALRMYMEAVTGAERLNAIKLDEQVAKGGGDQQEQHKRQQELEYSKRRLETVGIMTIESRYNVETTTRSMVVRR